MAKIAHDNVSRRRGVWKNHAAALIGAMPPGDRGRSLILPDSMGHAPITPLVGQGDEQWFKMVELSTYAMFEASRIVAEHGMPLKPGWVVMAGGATAAKHVKPGIHLRVVAQSLGRVDLHVGE